MVAGQYGVHGALVLLPVVVGSMIEDGHVIIRHLPMEDSTAAMMVQGTMNMRAAIIIHAQVSLY